MMIALYWGGAMVGRFYGSFMLSNVEKSKKYLYTGLVIATCFVCRMVCKKRNN